jgi:hypothetical protein
VNGKKKMPRSGEKRRLNNHHINGTTKIDIPWIKLVQNPQNIQIQSILKIRKINGE